MANLSEITGLTPIVLIIAFSLIVLISVFGLFIFIEFKRIRKILVDNNQKLVVLEQHSEKHSPESNLAEISGYKKIFTSNPYNYSDSNKQLKDFQETRTTFPIRDKIQRHASKGISDKLLSMKRETTTNINIEEFSKSFSSNPELKSAVLKLLKASDMPYSLKQIAKNLSRKYFDGNYHLILIELDHLEKDGLIEGVPKSGKVYFRVKY